MLNSLSKVLSTNEKLFASGLAIKGCHGWWGLHVWEAPEPPTSAIASVLKESASQSKRSYETLKSSEADVSSDSDLSVSDSDESIVQVTERPVPSAELKQQLLERLLMMDSSILTDAIKKAKAKKLQEEKRSQRQRIKKPKTVQVTPPLEAASAPETGNDYPSYLKPFMQEKVPISALNRLSPHENEIIKRCTQVSPPTTYTNRLLRKLLVRRLKRKAMLPVFDIDTCIYNYLKAPEEPLLLASSKESKEQVLQVAKTFPITFNPEDIPYMADPSLSMYAKLTGMRALYGQIPYPITSPFTGKQLEPFVFRDTDFSCSKMKLLKEIRDFGGVVFGNDIYESDSEDEAEEGDDSSIEERKESLDFAHLRKEFVEQCNALLSLSFWSGIDVSEALDYPDYTMLALYRHAVVGCAFVTPDGYLSYLHVRPDFQGFGIAKKLLSLLLLAISPRKDVTLHVSVTNSPAILLYQQFGFKPEEFIVNFYEKYYPADYLEHSKNAFLMRLKR